MNKPHKTVGCSPPDPNPLITTYTMNEVVGAAQHIPCSAETVTYAAPASTSCTLCGFTGSPKEYADHNCFANRDDPPESDRFDPFEALDTILRFSGSGTCSEAIVTEVQALRAYITGMER